VSGRVALNRGGGPMTGGPLAPGQTCRPAGIAAVTRDAPWGGGGTGCALLGSAGTGPAGREASGELHGDSFTATKKSLARPSQWDDRAELRDLPEELIRRPQPNSAIRFCVTPPMVVNSPPATT
jgi:hypothetical protein